MPLKARYFAWLEELAPEGGLPLDALDDLENAIFAPFDASVRALETWLSAHGERVTVEGRALVRAVPFLFDGRTAALAERVRTHCDTSRDTAHAGTHEERDGTSLRAELAFLDTLTRWRLEQPVGLWDSLLKDRNVAPHPRVLARVHIEKAASLMNQGALVEALATLEAARAKEHVWDG